MIIAFCILIENCEGQRCMLRQQPSEGHPKGFPVEGVLHCRNQMRPRVAQDTRSPSSFPLEATLDVGYSVSGCPYQHLPSPPSDVSGQRDRESPVCWEGGLDSPPSARSGSGESDFLPTQHHFSPGSLHKPCGGLFPGHTGMWRVYDLSLARGHGNPPLRGS